MLTWALQKDTDFYIVLKSSLYDILYSDHRDQTTRLAKAYKRLKTMENYKTFTPAKAAGCNLKLKTENFIYTRGSGAY